MLDDLGGKIAMILDGGRATAGLESTIVSFVGEQAALLRPGVIAQEDIEAVLGSSLAAPKGGVEAPGMLASHYAPRARLRLGAVALASDEAGLDFCRSVFAAPAAGPR